ncbi:MAG: methylenetetrahydrofolate dehydrogenase [candidate division NC10 bacterium]|nr:methylenetetrahydrofolate dehydrogenase [candidate division NC10 bacterium]
MKKVLLQLDSDRQPSAFDRIVALDAGVDEVLSYGGLVPADVASLVHGVIFTRGPQELHHTALWAGGGDVAAGEALLEAAQKAFFGPFRVSLMMDSNGCNTTAAAAVARLAGVVDLKGARAVILAGTGPVGLRAAVLLGREGASVTLSSRSMERAQAACERLRSRFGVEVTPAEARDDRGVARAVEGAQVCLAAGAAGTTLLRRAVWATHPTLKAMADVNAVPPLGIEGIEATDKGTERDGRKVFGALGVGGLKMKVHKACVVRLFERNDQVLDIDVIYAVARSL